MTEAAPERRCNRCGRTVAEVKGLWNVEVEDGRVVGYICPDDQNVEDNVEAAVNEALDADLIDENDPAVQSLAAQMIEVVEATLLNAAKVGEPVNAYLLADDALARIVPLVGATESEVRETYRDRLADLFLILTRPEGGETPDAL